MNLIGSKQINAFCMPGGKIAFYTGILDQLKLSDDEAAMVMGHEMAHALREHARARLAKTQATSMGLSLGAQLLGLGDLGNVAANLGTQLLSLKFSRSDETEADLVGLEMAARGGYNPNPPSRSGARWAKPPATRAGSPSCPRTRAGRTASASWSRTCRACRASTRPRGVVEPAPVTPARRQSTPIHGHSVADSSRMSARPASVTSSPTLANCSVPNAPVP